MAINIYCPKCNEKLSTRTSERPTETTVQAVIYCGKCLNFRGLFIGEITHQETAEWQTLKDIKQLKKQGKQP